MSRAQEEALKWHLINISKYLNEYEYKDFPNSLKKLIKTDILPFIGEKDE